MKNFNLYFLILAAFICSVGNAKELHVSVKGNDFNDGSGLKPFRSISTAASNAFPGDTITVHEGIYREWINPPRGGESDAIRILYRSAPGEKVEIKGSEIVTGWKKVKNGVWKVTLPNSYFGEYNPYKDSIAGDWFNNLGRIHHTGEVFLNRKSLYEKEKIEKVFDPVPNKDCIDPEGSTYTWYCESDDENTSIWVNFHQFNPNKEVIEISTRKTCFYPAKPGINYITIRGFYFNQAATQWAAPTAEQIGMISSHWNKGWIIEDNIVSDSKCSGITLGKERGTGHNVWSADKTIDGAIHYIEVIFRTLRNGWSKENIGSHIVRNNIIYNCEQAGICGSMGGAFSLISNNHIYNIHQKNQFTGAEIGGIKLHAAIDTRIEKNCIHDVLGYGCWFDWMTQGTRISRNLFYNNGWTDLFIEVSHGPYLVDDNLMLSKNSIRSMSEGGAFVHNLISGTIILSAESRFTPYHLPHSTDIAGLAAITAGDDRYYNNIFIGRGSDLKNEDKIKYGLKGYNGIKGFPCWIDDNVYYNGALPYGEEKNYFENRDFNPEAKIIEEKGNIYLHLVLDDSYFEFKTRRITTAILGMAKMPHERYEHPDGTPLEIDTDFFGNKRLEENVLAGPFSHLSEGAVKVRLR